MASSSHDAARAPYDHDLIIVGGGPAGISTALFLIAAHPELSSRIVVLEKEYYPREKYCAGALAGRGDAALARIGVRVDVPSMAIHGLSLKLPRGTVGARGPCIGRVVRRIEFDHELAKIAMARGVRVLQGVTVNQVAADTDGVTLQTSAGTLRTRAVVGADGVGSVVRKSFDAAPGPWRAQVMEVDTPFTGVEAADVLHFDCEDQTYAGYEWDFPTIVEGKAMVCRGAYQLLLPGERRSLSLEERLARRLSAVGLTLSDCKKKRYAERGFAPGAQLSRERLLLVGEAAGIDPVTGEGIAQAIEYGRWAARYLAPRLAKDRLHFRDWSRSVALSPFGIDLRVRSELCRRFFGPARGFYTRWLAEHPRVMEVGIQYFGGLPVDRFKLARIGGELAASLWRYRAERPLRALRLEAPRRALPT